MASFPTCLNALIVGWCLLTALISSTGSTTCYSCNGNWGSTACIDRPLQSSTVVCGNDEACVTKRIEYIWDNTIYNFARGCEKQMIARGDPVNMCDSGSVTMRTCTSLCYGDLCNTGDGDPTGSALERAMEKSGLFVEASTASGLAKYLDRYGHAPRPLRYSAAGRPGLNALALAAAAFVAWVLLALIR